MKRNVTVVAGVALLLAVGYLLAPPLGTDLSAQVARAEFFAAHGFAPIDLRWYGGTNQFGYSLVSPALMAGLGVRTVAVLSLLVASVAFAALLVRVRVHRPLLGGVVGAVCIAGNLASGRVTYGLGIAFGLLALLALTTGHKPLRYGLATCGAVLAAVTSPVAGLFVGMTGVALLLSRSWAGAWLAAGSGLGIGVVGLWFGEGGIMNISGKDAWTAILASVIVAVLAAHRPVRFGALLSAAGVAAAYVLTTPVGLNATRAAVMFALPVLAATAKVPRWLPGAEHRGWRCAGSAIVVAVVLAVAPPLLTRDLTRAGDRADTRSYYAPLNAALKVHNAYRVEVVPTRGYWEAAYVEPLARGWLRQVDLERNPLFYELQPTGTKLTAENFYRWLRDTAVSHVAVSDATPSRAVRPETDLVNSGLPYLTEVWRNADWRLFAVADPEPLVPGLVDQDAATVTFDAAEPGPVSIRVRYSRWLTLPGGRLAAGPDGWTIATVPAAGRYTLTSRLYA